MNIEKNKVVTIEYTLKDNAGEVLDTSEGRGPLAFIQGIGNIIEGLEEALEGKVSGDKLDVSIPPEKGYGARNEGLVQKAQRSNFQEGMEINVGMQFQAEIDEHVHIFTVKKIEGDDITLDGNHPLAGETLNFNVEVVGVRDAEAEELDHGHVHGPGGHQH